MSLQDYIDELTQSLDFAESVEQWRRFKLTLKN